MVYRNKEMEKWANDFVRTLPLERPLNRTRELIADFVKIGRRAYFTTFTDDSGISKNGIELSRLEKYNHYTVKRCLTAIQKSPKNNPIIKYYLDRFRTS